MSLFPNEGNFWTFYATMSKWLWSGIDIYLETRSRCGSLWLRALKMGCREENTDTEQESSILLISNIPTQKVSLIRKFKNISSIQLKIKTVPISVVNAQKKSFAVSRFFSYLQQGLETQLSQQKWYSLSFYQTVITENFNVQLFWTSASNPTQAQNRALVTASSRVSNDSAEIVKVVKCTDIMRFLTACIPQKKITWH